MFDHDEQTYEQWKQEREQERTRTFWSPMTAEEIREQTIDRVFRAVLFFAFLALVAVIGAR